MYPGCPFLRRPNILASTAFVSLLDHPTAFLAFHEGIYRFVTIVTTLRHSLRTSAKHALLRRVQFLRDGPHVAHTQVIHGVRHLSSRLQVRSPHRPCQTFRPIPDIRRCLPVKYRPVLAQFKRHVTVRGVDLVISHSYLQCRYTPRAQSRRTMQTSWCSHRPALAFVMTHVTSILAAFM